MTGQTDTSTDTRAAALVWAVEACERALAGQAKHVIRMARADARNPEHELLVKTEALLLERQAQLAALRELAPPADGGDYSSPRWELIDAYVLLAEFYDSEASADKAASVRAAADAERATLTPLPRVPALDDE